MKTNEVAGRDAADCCCRFSTLVLLHEFNRISHHINAPRTAVYRAFLDPHAVVMWKVPAGMTSHVHEFDAREGGAFRFSLTYDAAERIGKTSTRTDMYRGRFVKFVPNEQVVQVDEFESTDPDLRGEMTITITLVEQTVAHVYSSKRNDGVVSLRQRILGYGRRRGLYAADWR
jgi:uncharacterized protein YndB with AHSA1/START domain